MVTRAPVVPGRPLSQGATLTVEQAVDSIAGAYRIAERELRTSLERYVQIAALDPTSTARYRVDRERALLARLAIMRADLDGQAVLFADDTMARVYNGGVSRANRALGIGAASPGGMASFATVHREALEMMAVDAYNDLAAATGYMDAQAKRVIRETAKLRTAVGAATGATIDADTRALVRALSREGVTGFVDAAGHRWRISTYAEMVVRTKSAHAYNTGTVLRTEETGTRALVIRDGESSGHEACLAYSGSTCSPGWALANPIEHPNCVRGFAPLPLHRGPVTHGAGEPSAREQITAEHRRRQDAGELDGNVLRV